MARDICDDILKPIHQFNKLDEITKERYDVYPITLLQAIFDKSGIRLDTILSYFNFLYLPFKGTVEDTKLQILPEYRRKGLFIIYQDLEDNIVWEISKTNHKEDKEWIKSEHWINFEEELNNKINTAVSNAIVNNLK